MGNIWFWLWILDRYIWPTDIVSLCKRLFLCFFRSRYFHYGKCKLFWQKVVAYYIGLGLNSYRINGQPDIPTRRNKYMRRLEEIHGARKSSRQRWWFHRQFSNYGFSCWRRLFISRDAEVDEFHISSSNSCLDSDLFNIHLQFQFPVLFLLIGELDWDSLVDGRG